MAHDISQTTLLFNTYLLINQSLRVPTASATSLTLQTFKKFGGNFKGIHSKFFLEHDTTT